MSTFNTREDSLKNNEEAQVLKVVFNMIKDKKENKDIESKDSSLLEKYKIKNIQLEKIDGFDVHPRNRYMIKLQKIFFKKNINKKMNESNIL